jgi:fucose permease
VLEGAVRHDTVATKRKIFQLALALTSFTVAASIALSAMPIVTSGLQDRFGFSASQIGLLTSVFMVTFAVGALPMGLLGARWGGLALVGGATLLTAGLILFALSDS